MKAEIIAIGSELVSGQKLDTNSQWLSRELASAGDRGRLPHDDRRRPGRARRGVPDRGRPGRAGDHDRRARPDPGRPDPRGPGRGSPGVPLVEDPASLAAIAAMFARRNRPMAERNRVQALFPEGAEPLPNRVGTAPGIWMALRRRSTFACLPGVPSEMKVMFAGAGRPPAARLGWVGRRIVHRARSTCSARGESDIEAEADRPDRARPRPRGRHHGARRDDQLPDLRRGGDRGRGPPGHEPTAELIHERFGSLVVGEGTDDPRGPLRGAPPRGGVPRVLMSSSLSTTACKVKWRVKSCTIRNELCKSAT